MANQIQATVYQIDGNPLPSPMEISFLTSDIFMRSNFVLTIPQVQSSITYYPNTSNQLETQTFFVSEPLNDLLMAANAGGTSQISANILEVDGDPIGATGIGYTFPANGVSIWPSVNPASGVNSFLIFKNKRYSASETEGDLVAQANSGGGGGGLITISKAQLDDLINANALVAGQFYKITGVNVDLYGGTDVILQAATSNQLESQGSGIFYNPKYDTYPIWTKYMSCNIYNVSAPFIVGEPVTGGNGATAIFLSNGLLDWTSGDWSAETSITGDYSSNTADVSGATSPTYNIDDKVIWGGKVWLNKDGTVSNSTNTYILGDAWTSLEAIYNPDDYNVVVDEIKYWYEQDFIYFRRDAVGNIVDGFNNEAIKAFQWGNNHVVGNNLIQDSYCENINFRGGAFAFNTMSQNSYFGNGNIFETDCYFEYNTLSDESYVGGNTCSNGAGIDSNTLIDSAIYSSQLSQYAEIYYNNLNNSALYYNQLTSSYIYSNDLSSSTIDFNILYSDCNMGNNSLSQQCHIEYNEISNSSYMNYNALQNSSFISNNILYTSNVISSNSLTESSKIYYNTLDYNNGISSNNLFGRSEIYSNQMAEQCSIGYNELSSNSYIDNNTMTFTPIGSNILTQGSYIDLNDLNNASIESNNLSIYSSIYNNFALYSYIYNDNLTQSSSIRNADLNSSSVYANNLFNGRMFLDVSGTLSSVALSYITMNHADIDVDISGATAIYGDYTKNIIKAGGDLPGYYLTYIPVYGPTPPEKVMYVVAVDY